MSLRNIIILISVMLVLGVTYYFVRPTPTAETAEAKIYVWSIDMNEIKHIEINLLRENQSASFISIDEGDKFPWHFDNTEQTSVDSVRWGGGVPLLLSGPGADRIISQEATQEQMDLYGLSNPNMEVVVTLNSGYALTIKVGDRTPDGGNYYVKAPSTNAIATVDYTWYDIISGLVTNPPVAKTATK